MNDEVRKYMAEIGRKGGSAGKGTDWRREVCKHAAVVRWRAHRERKRIEAEEDKERQEIKEHEERLAASLADMAEAKVADENILEPQPEPESAPPVIPLAHLA
jgi:hypothetical protein